WPLRSVIDFGCFNTSIKKEKARCFRIYRETLSLPSRITLARRRRIVRRQQSGRDRGELRLAVA
ncbi:hypothetical protein ABLO16_11160, partial [Mycobacterium tuberculosis]